MIRTPLQLGATLGAAALILTGCQSVPEGAIDAEALACPEGSDCFDPVIPVGEGGKISIVSGDLFFEFGGANSKTDELHAVAVQGAIEIDLDNQGVGIHNFRVDAAVGDEKKIEADGGAMAVGELLLFPGEYTFYCDIAGHRAAGMEGTLVVAADKQAADELEAEG